MAMFLLSLYLFIVSTVITESMHPLSDEFIDYINEKQNLWRAGRNFHKNTSLVYLKRLAGSTLRDDEDPIEDFEDFDDLAVSSKNIPAHFDARKKWSICPTLLDIRDQGGCSSCWAVATASAMTDAICIQSKGRKDFYFSAEDILSCCKECWPSEYVGGCDGGSNSAAWKFSKRHGVVSGGSYYLKYGCRPYTIPPCVHLATNSCSEGVTPLCEHTCQSQYKINYYRDKHKVNRVKILKSKTIEEIQSAIMTYGPVTTRFQVYEDFYHYKCGIYRLSSGEYVASHNVKVIGWGEDDEKYWIVSNSWNTSWGHNGFFKIIRGENHLDFESVMYFGIFT